MNVSPLDLRQQRFRTRLRGFDKIEVTAFLTAVADDYEQALRETDNLRQELGKLEAVLNEHRESEQNLRNTLLTAQRLSDEMKEHADQEAKRVLREAEGRASLLLEKAQIRLDDVQRDIDSLCIKRREVETTLEASIQTLRHTLEYVRERAGRENDDKILLHRPRQAADAPAADNTSLDQARSR
jgi:cell division initiation protein